MCGCPNLPMETFPIGVGDTLRTGGEETPPQENVIERSWFRANADIAYGSATLLHQCVSDRL